MEILISLAICLVTVQLIFAVDFTHSNQGTTNISEVVMPGNVDQADLRGNSFGILGIPSDYFVNFPQLARLWLQDNLLNDSSIPDYCFTGIGNILIVLKMGDNLLTRIRRHQFSGLSVLDQLQLNKNSIHTIEQGNVNTFFVIILFSQKKFLRGSDSSDFTGLETLKF